MPMIRVSLAPPIVFFLALGCNKATSDGEGMDAGDDGGATVDREWALWPVVEQPAYVVGANTVEDPGTGLIWLRAEETGTITDGEIATYSWDSAKSRCGELAAATFEGRSDWRLPTVAELISIIDVTRAGPAIDVAAFPGTGTFYWSSTQYADPNGGPWGVAFDVGFSSLGLATGSFYVRCVSGGRTPAAAHYKVTDEIVRDQWTALTWQRVLDGAARSWTAAAAYCAALNLGEFSSGWRVPSYKELLTLVDRRRYLPAVETAAFPEAPSEFTWSSSSCAFTGACAWGVDFAWGGSDYKATGAAHPVRCVR